MDTVNSKIDCTTVMLNTVNLTIDCIPVDNSVYYRPQTKFGAR